ncbi:hypothetical protein BO71DRAFT_372510 [Aspergillus ellipticus CBS 707.79]|uniref:Serine hydrolase domain-containing protein n=1 Tax=Aspergillus ellipticus CBS 707.79 TaxID=1448320 RepID=A0A319E2C3_9EURO|nr:hypothetical protein BO71DRAFT_372510 [Aspergillus ellipticus CBS 707.79]
MSLSNPNSPKPKKFRILMLHGYAQSARVFRIKMRLLMEQITHSITPTLSNEYPGGIEFLFPDGPVNLHAPGTSSSDPERDPENQAWWLNLDDISRYIFLNETIQYLADFLNGEPIHGAIGFSQGGALAVMISSMCEATINPKRIQAIQDQGIPANTFLDSLPGQQPLKFVLSFCGFKGTMDYYSSLYTSMLRTPSFHAIGAFDTMIAAEKSELLVNSFVAPQVMHYFGGHFIPRDRESLRAIMGFLQRTCYSEAKDSGSIVGVKKAPEQRVLLDSSVPGSCRIAKMFLIRRRPVVQMCRVRRTIA